MLHRRDGVPIMTKQGRENKLQIPYKSGTGDYSRAFRACRKFGKSYPELTDEEKGVRVYTSPESPNGLVAAITKLTEEMVLLSLEIQELRIAARRLKVCT